MAIGQGDEKKGSLARSLSCSNCGSGAIIFGRKRVAVSPTPGSRSPHSPTRTLRKQRSVRFHMEDDGANLFNQLSLDVLVMIFCKVNHSDLRNLLLTSKSVKEATILAREQHFKFSTPPAKSGFRDEETAAGDDDDEGPGAPKQHRVARSRLGDTNLSSIAVNLSASFEQM